MNGKITKTDQDWRAHLSDMAYRVTRKHGTERPFTHDSFPEGPGNRNLGTGGDNAAGRRADHPLPRGTRSALLTPGGGRIQWLRAATAVLSANQTLPELSGRGP